MTIQTRGVLEAPTALGRRSQDSWALASTAIVMAVLAIVLSRVTTPTIAALVAFGIGALGVVVWRVRGSLRPALGGAAIGAAVVIPFALPRLISVDNATIACAHAIIAVSQYVITGLSGQMSLGQGAFAALGAYGFAVPFSSGLPWVVSLVIGMALAAIGGLIVGLIALRLQELYLAMVTLALVVAFAPLVKLDLVSGMTGGANGLLLDLPWIPGAEFLGSSLTLYVIALVLLAAVVIVVRAVAASRHGLALRALEFSEVSARSSGVPLFGYRMSAFLSASAIAGLGGGVYVMVLGIVTPDSFALPFSLQFLMMIVLGGMRRPSGAIVGAALVWWLGLNLDGFELPIGPNGFDVLPGAVFGLAVILVVLFLRDGVTGGIVRLWSFASSRIRRLVAGGRPSTEVR